MNRWLLIDDDSGVRELYKSWHDKADETFRGRFGLETTSDLEKADELIKEKEYDIIIVDWHLIPGGAEETAKWVQKHSADPEFPPIIVITGNEDVMIRQKAIACGAAQFFTKRDAEELPNSFFKIAYNEFLRYFCRNAPKEVIDRTIAKQR